MPSSGTFIENGKGKTGSRISRGGSTKDLELMVMALGETFLWNHLVIPYFLFIISENTRLSPT